MTLTAVQLTETEVDSVDSHAEIMTTSYNGISQYTNLIVRLPMT